MLLVDRRTIRHLHWQPRVDFTTRADGEFVVGLADLEQEIRSIILSPLGSVPLNPEKGCDLTPYVDRPPAVGIPAMTREIWRALTRWVVRITVTDVRVETVAFHHYRFPVFWRPVRSVSDEIKRTVVDYVV